MSNYSIKVNCTCGKVLKIPEKYAGKRGRCPNCGKKIAIPELKEIKQKLVKEKEPGEQEVRNCPTCGAFLNPGDVICVSCRTNLQTGEWDAEGQTPYTSPKQQYSLQYAGASILIILIVVAGVLLFPKDEPLKTSLKPNPTNQDLAKQHKEIVNTFSTLNRLPENTVDAIEYKLKSFDEFLEYLAKLYVEEEAVKTIKQLPAQHRKMLAQSAYKGLSQNNPYTYYKGLEKLSHQYSDTEYAKQNIQPKMQTLAKDIAKKIKTSSEEAENFVDQKKYQAAIVESFSAVLKIAKASSVSSEVKPELEELEALYKKALKNLHYDHGEQEQPNVTKEPVDDLKDKVMGSMVSYKKYSDKWQFTKAIKELEPLVLQIQELPEESRSNSQFTNALQAYKDVQILSGLWKNAQRGLKKVTGKQRTMALKDGKFANGVIVKYNKRGKILIQGPKKAQRQVIAMNQLRHNEIIGLAKESDASKQEIYEGAAYFHLLNGDAYSAKGVLEELSKDNKGNLPKHLDPIFTWATNFVTEKQDQLAQGAQRKLTQQEKDQLEQEAKRLATIHKKAWNIIRKLVGDYKRGLNLRVLNYLKELQEIVPRAELIKISKRVKKQEGHSLVKIAERAFGDCKLCRGNHELTCDSCSGIGTKTITKRLGDNPSSSVTKTQLCKKCIGHKVLDCPNCIKRQDDRKYKLLVDWYKGF